MNTYDEIVGFDYTSVEEWHKFVKEQILPLHKAISKIIKLRGHLEHLIRDDLPNLIKDNTSVRQILLGGVDEKGEYKPNSLAKLFKEILGISINPTEWVSLCKQSGIDASEYIKCDFSDTEFLQFIDAIKKDREKLLSLVEVGNIDEEDIEEIFENPEKIVEELKAICRLLINISANHNYHTFFCLNTRCILRGYIEQAYPKLKDNFESVAEFLGLEPKFVPDVKEGKIRSDYTIWGHKEAGFAELVYKLNKTIWKYTRLGETLKLIGVEVRSLKEEYIAKIKAALENFGWKFPENIRTSYPPNTHYTYNISGIMLTSYYYSGVSARGNYWSGTENCNISILQLMDDLSPALFLGSCDVDTNQIKHKRLEILETL